MGKTAFTTEDGVTVDIGSEYWYIAYGNTGKPKLYFTKYETVHDYKKGNFQFFDKVKASWALLNRELSLSAGFATEVVAVAFHKHLTTERIAGREMIGKTTEELFQDFVKTL